MTIRPMETAGEILIPGVDGLLQDRAPSASTRLLDPDCPSYLALRWGTTSGCPVHFQSMNGLSGRAIRRLHREAYS
jgi:hypothetical protein